jgi:hypothetical protein
MMPTSPAAWIREGDRVCLPRARRFVRVVGISPSPMDSRYVRVTYADINSGKGIRTRAIRTNARVILYPNIGGA